MCWVGEQLRQRCPGCDSIMDITAGWQRAAHREPCHELGELRPRTGGEVGMKLSLVAGTSGAPGAPVLSKQVGDQAGDAVCWGCSQLDLCPAQVLDDVRGHSPKGHAIHLERGWVGEQVQAWHVCAAATPLEHCCSAPGGNQIVQHYRQKPESIGRGCGTAMHCHITAGSACQLQPHLPGY